MRKFCQEAGSMIIALVALLIYFFTGMGLFFPKKSDFIGGGSWRETVLISIGIWATCPYWVWTMHKK